jgi:hypothetical protein
VQHQNNGAQKMLTLPDGSKVPWKGQPQSPVMKPAPVGPFDAFLDWLSKGLTDAGGLPEVKQQQKVVPESSDAMVEQQPVDTELEKLKAFLGFASNRENMKRPGAVTKAPDMMGTLYDRIAQQRQQQQQLLSQLPNGGQPVVAQPNRFDLAAVAQRNVAQQQAQDDQLMQQGFWTPATAGQKMLDMKSANPGGQMNIVDAYRNNTKKIGDPEQSLYQTMIELNRPKVPKAINVRKARLVSNA